MFLKTSRVCIDKNENKIGYKNQLGREKTNCVVESAS